MHRYYHILGLLPGASAQEIKRAYRKLALQYHPDVNKEPGAKERFLHITEAYTYLMNPPRSATPSPEKQRKAEEERVKRAKAAATKAARQRYEAFKRRQEAAQGRAYSNAIKALLGILFLAGGLYFSTKYLTIWYVDQNGAAVNATVFKTGVRHFWLQYTVNGTVYVKKVTGRRSTFFLVADNGMPVFTDVEFIVRYRKDQPQTCYVTFDHVLPATFNLYQEALITPIATQYNLNRGDPRIECLTLLVFEQYGIDGWANLFFWDESFLENFSHNSHTYTRMTQDSAFQKIQNNCLLTQE